MDKPNIKQIILETERLLLREVNPEILYNLFNFYTDEEIMAFMGLESETQLEMERLKYEGGYTTFRTSMKLFLIADKGTGKVIGRTGFHTWHLPHDRAEMGYAIHDERYMGKGYMKEANRAAIEFGFDQMRLNRIEAFTSPDNDASIALLHSLGFKEEGTLRQHYFKDNRIHDSVCYGLLKREYNGR